MVFSARQTLSNHMDIILDTIVIEIWHVFVCSMFYSYGCVSLCADVL